ncbi:DUF2544 domain-containing protein, partial [Shigella flexneri]|nr:DUF2544 domain-containing protein [Shigella flexneri]
NVNTSSGQPIDSTCRFQYVLNELKFVVLL